jgi:hypothetical protein
MAMSLRAAVSACQRASRKGETFSFNTINRMLLSFARVAVIDSLSIDPRIALDEV